MASVAHGWIYMIVGLGLVYGYRQLVINLTVISVAYAYCVHGDPVWFADNLRPMFL